MAQMGAFEFYTKMKEDRKAAWADYYKLCAAGGSMGYFDLLKYSGLHKVLDDGSVKIIMKGACLRSWDYKKKDKQRNLFSESSSAAFSSRRIQHAIWHKLVYFSRVGIF